MSTLERKVRKRWATFHSIAFRVIIQRDKLSHTDGMNSYWLVIGWVEKAREREKIIGKEMDWNC